MTDQLHRDPAQEIKEYFREQILAEAHRLRRDYHEAIVGLYTATAEELLVQYHRNAGAIEALTKLIDNTPLTRKEQDHV